jgi:hypothetical protein
LPRWQQQQRLQASRPVHTAYRRLLAVLAAAFLPQGFMVNYDLERDIWQKGFASLAAAAAGQVPGMGGGASGGGSSSGRSRAALDCRSYSLLLTEPLFNFDAVRAATEEVRGIE